MVEHTRMASWLLRSCLLLGAVSLALSCKDAKPKTGEPASADADSPEKSESGDESAGAAPTTDGVDRAKASLEDAPSPAEPAPNDSYIRIEKDIERATAETPFTEESFVAATAELLDADSLYIDGLFKAPLSETGDVLGARLCSKEPDGWHDNWLLLATPEGDREVIRFTAESKAICRGPERAESGWKTHDSDRLNLFDGNLYGQYRWNQLVVRDRRAQLAFAARSAGAGPRGDKRTDVWIDWEEGRFGVTSAPSTALEIATRDTVGDPRKAENAASIRAGALLVVRPTDESKVQPVATYPLGGELPPADDFALSMGVDHVTEAKNRTAKPVTTLRITIQTVDDHRVASTDTPGDQIVVWYCEKEECWDEALGSSSIRGLEIGRGADGAVISKWIHPEGATDSLPAIQAIDESTILLELGVESMGREPNPELVPGGSTTFPFTVVGVDVDPEQDRPSVVATSRFEPRAKTFGRIVALPELGAMPRAGRPLHPGMKIVLSRHGEPAKDDD